jgi:predicted phosphoserine aminotransferase
MFGHRGPHIRELMSCLQGGLRRLFLTERPVYVSTSSATGLMEAGVRNGVRSRMLALVNGAFSDRFARIGRACGKEVEVMEVPWGEVHDPGDVARRLAEGGVDAVTLVHSETSTGALQPLEALASAVAEHDDVLLLVDSVTGLGGVPLRTDDWGLDFVLTGSQKALAVPPGISLAVASRAMLERAATVEGRGLYFDLLAFEKNIQKLQTPNTPALSLLHALAVQLERMASEGLEARWDRHEAMAARCRRWVMEEAGRMPGLRVLAPEGARSPTVTCIVLPEDLPGPRVVEGLRGRGWVVGSGYGKLKPTTFRIGHMGDHTVEELDALLAETGEVLSREAATVAGGAP